jgi:hypothetical protein
MPAKGPPEETALPPILHKRLEGSPQIKALTPSESDLHLINQMTPGPVTAEDVAVFGMRLANDQLDRSNERFPVSYLQRFADTIPGKSLMVGHDYSKAPSGRFISGEVRSDELGHHLYAKAYVAASSELAEQVRLGIAKDVSIGFKPDTLKCDICQLSYTGSTDGAWCPHIAGRSYDGRLCTLTYGGDTSPSGPVEALEGSSVWLGCQRGAEISTNAAMAALHARKAAWVDAEAAKQPREKREEDMDEIKELQAEVARLTALAAQGKEYAEAGKAYLAHLKAEVLRKAGVLELGEAYTALAGGADLKQLVEINAALDAKVAADLAPVPGAHAGDGNGEEKPAASKRCDPLAPRRRVC